MTGALIYRAGILHPLNALVKGIFSQGLFYPGLPEPVIEVGLAVQDEVRMYEDNGLPTLYIDMPFESYEKLLEKRNEALSIGVLNTTDDDFVPGQVQLQDGPKLDAKFRLKGDWTDHLEGEKWSFRIHLKEDGQILGTRQFSIQTPQARNFLYEWAFHKVLQKEELLAPRYSFVNVLLNGKLLGIYALEENFAPELLESQGRRQGVIIRFNEDPYWQNVSVFRESGITQESDFSVTTMESADINVFQESKISEDSVLSAEAETARGLLRAFQSGQRPASEVFDVHQMGLFFALHDLWNAEHGVAWHNLRFYYNPVTALLEPVAYDAMPFYTQITEPTLVNEFIQTRIFNDPVIREAYALELERITSPDYLTTLEQELTQEHDRLLKALKVEFAEKSLPPYYQLSVDWNQIRERAKILALELQPAEVIRGSYQAVNMLPGSTGAPELALDIVNFLILPVEIDRVEVNDKAIPLGELSITLPPVIDPRQQSFEPTHILLPLSGQQEPSLTELLQVAVVGHINGTDREFRTILSGEKLPEAIRTGPAPTQPSLAEVLAQHPFLTVHHGQPDTLMVSPGVWDVTGDLILPVNMNLLVLSGTTLRFGAGNILYGNGTVDFLGESGATILITAQDDGWGGMVVSNVPGDSHWKYATVEKTTGIDRSGWTLTGGITFYKSNIQLNHVLIGNNETEDAINVIHGNFQFEDSVFANTSADAFDSDFSDGTIVNCVFKDIIGDAIDTSGTKLTVRDSRMDRVTDKAVSAGEDSDVSLTNLFINEVGIGVASKDLSKVTLSKAEIRKARFSALAAYMKKPVYGPGWLEANEVTILETEKDAVAQEGSTIILNGHPVETVDLDVDRLYAEGVLGN